MCTLKCTSAFHQDKWVHFLGKNSARSGRRPTLLHISENIRRPRGQAFLCNSPRVWDYPAFPFPGRKKEKYRKFCSSVTLLPSILTIQAHKPAAAAVCTHTKFKSCLLSLTPTNLRMAVFKEAGKGSEMGLLISVSMTFWSKSVGQSEVCWQRDKAGKSSQEGGHRWLT